MPHGIHAWAQADRLSLAVNFYDNGMNFFKPATNSLYSEQGITGVEFPIQAYIAALGGKIFGREYISLCFRLLDTIVSCIGLIFLFRAGYKRTKDFVCSAVTPLFVFCSPIYIYYTCNYLPDTVAASLVFIAFYYTLFYSEEFATKHFVRAVLFLTLATLIKTSVGLYLCGFLLWTFFINVKTERPMPQKTPAVYLSVAISGIVIVGYYFYNRYLNTTYKSGIFLAAANPFKDLADVRRYINSIREVWLFEYFLPVQYLLLVVFGFWAGRIIVINRRSKLLPLLAFIFACGVLAMLILLGRQLVHHDYYIISIFLPLCVFVLMLSVILVFSSIVQPKSLFYLRIGCLVIISVCFITAANHHHNRIAHGIAGVKPVKSWAEGGAAVLNTLKISRGEPILVVNEDAPNTELLLFDRKGINIDSRQWQYTKSFGPLLPQMWQYGMHIIVCESALAKSVLSDTNSTKNFSLIYLDDRMGVFKRK
jgi:hypothetical protein